MRVWWVACLIVVSYLRFLGCVKLWFYGYKFWAVCHVLGFDFVWIGGVVLNLGFWYFFAYFGLGLIVLESLVSGLGVSVFLGSGAAGL